MLAGMRQSRALLQGFRLSYDTREPNVSCKKSMPFKTLEDIIFFKYEDVLGQ